MKTDPPFTFSRKRSQKEELIRQSLICYMVEKLGYNKDFFVLEKAIGNLPFTRGTQAKTRRIDLLYLAKGIHPDWDLYPLLLVECKAVPLTKASIEQVKGYNRQVGAIFIAVTNGEETRTLWPQRGLKSEKEEEIPFLPHCQELIEAAKSIF